MLDFGYLYFFIFVSGGNILEAKKAKGDPLVVN